MFSFIENWVFLMDTNKIVSYTFGIAENGFMHWQWCAVHSLKNTDTRDAVRHVCYAVMYVMLSLLVQSS
jgi:hypothetical protein